ncbi:hypothetical protein ACM66B_002171 [Microbotryomycetes sp. NB124-2]
MAKSLAGNVEQQLAIAEDKAIKGEIDTTETPARYLALLARVRPVLQPATRYLAYTSDVGESVRPVVAPRVGKPGSLLLIAIQLGVSWAYILGDTAYEGYKMGLRADQYCPEHKNAVIGLGIAKRGTFQAIASMLFPSLTIHSVVRYSGKAIKRAQVQSLFVKRWGASLLGLFTIPALPYLFDKPVEHVVDQSFAWAQHKLYPDPNSSVHKALEDLH